MALNATFVKEAKHKGSPNGEKYADGGGMYLLVAATGKYWRMPARREMMQRWADYLDKLRVGADVILLRTATK